MGVRGTEILESWVSLVMFLLIVLLFVLHMLTFCYAVLHQYFLSLMGMNIGELWDLKHLSETCAKLKRYSFLLTSVPLNVPGGIGSPPNALALF